LIEETVNLLVRLRESLNRRLDEKESSPRVREGDEDEWFSLRDLEVGY